MWVRYTCKMQKKKECKNRQNYFFGSLYTHHLLYEANCIWIKCKTKPVFKCDKNLQHGFRNHKVMPVNLRHFFGRILWPWPYTSLFSICLPILLCVLHVLLIDKHKYTKKTAKTKKWTTDLKGAAYNRP